MRTIRDVIHALFPHGPNTLPQLAPEAVKEWFKGLEKPATEEPDPSSWPDCPAFPPDLFAATAYLLDVAGAYHYLVPGAVSTLSVDSASGTDADEVLGVDFHIPDGKNGFLRSVRTQEACNKAAGDWFEDPITPLVVKTLWEELGKHRGDKVFIPHTKDTAAPRWWSLAFSLMVIADAACPDVGYGWSQSKETAQTPADDGKTSPNPGVAPMEAYDNRPDTGEQELRKKSWTSLMIAYIEEEKLKKSHKLPDDTKKEKTPPQPQHINVKDQLWTLCLSVDPDIACVQAKSRSKNIGCSLRNMSLNLGLVSPRGTVRSIWHNPPFLIKTDDEATLNILLVPFPFRIPAKAFREPVHSSSADAREHADQHDRVRSWGHFDIVQQWLHGHKERDKENNRSAENEHEERREALKIFLNELMFTAKRDASSIHGIIFPEYALDWDTYEELFRFICEQHTKLEFFVAGSSQNCDQEEGNFAVSTVFTKNKDNRENSTFSISTSRSKHHRWRLDESQISTYALASELDPRLQWWENIPLTKREVHVNVFRETSTFAAMICEDLARSDPCHPILRSMAPNLVFVLLMDGPQLPTRWSARHSAAFADEPGSSILTLTSRALIHRSNTTLQDPDPSWSIAFWKDDSGKEVPIKCEPPAHGVVLSLSGYLTKDVSLDGRCNKKARSWRYHGHQPVTITRPSPSPTKTIDESVLKDIVQLITGEVDDVPGKVTEWYRNIKSK